MITWRFVQFLWRTCIIILIIYFVCLPTLSVSAKSGKKIPENETILHIAVPDKTRSDTKSVELVATLFKPDGPGPFPLAIVSHGSPRGGDAERRKLKRPVFRALSQALLDMGYVVLLPLRRGYGESGGNWAEGYGKCDEARYHAAGLEGARDLLAAAHHAQQQAFVRPDQVILIGTSAGGFASIAAGTLEFQGLRGIINVSGGRGSIRPGFVCSPKTLLASLSVYGKTSQVPSLWIYAENDQFFSMDMARAMYAAYGQQESRSSLVMIPPVDEDGHFLMKDANVPHILPYIQNFLRKINQIQP